jgi:hypothetical protein
MLTCFLMVVPVAAQTAALLQIIPANPSLFIATSVLINGYRRASLTSRVSAVICARRCANTLPAGHYRDQHADQ